MTDITTLVVEKLNQVLPTEYEMFLDTSQGLPCISYTQIENADEYIGNTQGYSRITFKIKIWCNEVSNITQYSKDVDTKMAELGRFRRNGVQDIQYGDLICRIMDYTILVNEIYIQDRYL